MPFDITQLEGLPEDFLEQQFPPARPTLLVMVEDAMRERWRWVLRKRPRELALFSECLKAYEAGDEERMWACVEKLVGARRDPILRSAFEAWLTHEEWRGDPNRMSLFLAFRFLHYHKRRRSTPEGEWYQSRGRKLYARLYKPHGGELMQALEAYGGRAARLRQLREELPGALATAEGEGHYDGTGGRLIHRVERIIINEVRPDSQRSEGGRAATLARREVEAARKRLRDPDLDARERVEAQRALRIAEEHLDQARANVLALDPGASLAYPRVLARLPEDPRELADFEQKDAELLAATLLAEAGLTGPEFEVLGLLQQGLTRKEIAAERGVGEETVKSQLSAARSKLKRAAGL